MLLHVITYGRLSRPDQRPDAAQFFPAPGQERLHDVSAQHQSLEAQLDLTETLPIVIWIAEYPSWTIP
jgi:hypothetical protein